MKKSLSLLLAVAMVFSMFASAALAADAELTTQQKFDALKDAGIFAGYEDGSAGLDKEMNRAQFARIAGLVAGLDVDAEPSVQTFTDVTANHWAYQEVEAAVAAGLLAGKGDGIYDPSGNVTVQQLAIVVAKLLGLDPVEGAEVEGAADWAAGSIQAILNAGIAFPTNYADNATRGQLVEVTYTVAAAVVPGVATGFTAAVTGAKKITVTFNGAVDDSKVKVSVLNGSNQVNTKSVNWATDKKSVVLEFNNNLAAAEYTVKVEGLSDEAVTQKLTVEAEKVDKIEFTSDVASLVRGNSKQVTTGYNVLNQYGEKINNTSVTATAAKGVASAVNGVLTITADSNYTLAEKVTVNIIHIDGAVASKQLEVGAVAQVASVDVVKLYEENDNELVAKSDKTFKILLSLKDQYGNTVTDKTYLPDDLLVTVSNQNAATVSNYVAADNKVNLAGWDTQTVDGTTYVTLTLATQSVAGPPSSNEFRAGTSTVTVMSKFNANRDSIELVVKELVKIDTLTLSAPTSAPAGSTVEIPYTAIDQFGAEIKHPENGMVTARSISGGVTADVFFEKNVVKDTTALKVNLPSTKGTAILTIITGTQKSASLTINVTDARIPTVVTGTKDFELALFKNNTAVIKKDRVVVQDQYGDNFDMDSKWGTEYRVLVETSDSGKVALSGTVVSGTSKYIVDNALEVTMTGSAKGSSTITLTLQKLDGTWKDVANSSYSFTEKVVDHSDVESYEAAAAGTVYTEAGVPADYAKSLNVKGILADGSKVTVTNSVYNYVVTGGVADLVTYNRATNKFEGIAGHDYDDKSSKEVSFVVTVLGDKAQDVKVVTVNVSKSTPAVETLEVVGNGTATKEDTNFVSVTASNINGANGLENLVNDAVKAVDQYGVQITEGLGYYTIVTGNLPSSRDIGTLVAGDTFTVTAVKGSKAVSFKVIVK